SGMLALLDDAERAAVLAHERSHLRHHHALFELVVRVAVALNPLVISLEHDVRFALERWARRRRRGDGASGRGERVGTRCPRHTRRDTTSPPVPASRAALALDDGTRGSAARPSPAACPTSV